MALIFGAIFISIGVIMLKFTDAPIIFPIVFMPIGLLIFSVGIWDLGKSLRVRVNQDQIFSRRFFLKYPVTSKTFPTNKINRLEIKVGSTISHGNKTTTIYSLIAHTNSAEKLVVAERLASKPEAEILKETIANYLE